MTQFDSLKKSMLTSSESQQRRENMQALILLFLSELHFKVTKQP